MFTDPYSNIHQANLLEAEQRRRSHIVTSKKEKRARKAVTSLQTDASMSAYNRAIAAVFSR